MGLLGALGAAAFDVIYSAVSALTLGDVEPALHPPPIWLRVLVPTLGGLAIGNFVRLASPDGGAAGIQDAIHSVTNQKGSMNLRKSLVSALSAALGIGFGLSGGREGPIVHLSAAFGAKLSAWTRHTPAQRRVLVAAGAAGGIAASFNTPIGAAFFALEIILGNFAMESFGPVVAAAVAGTALGQALLGDRIALVLPAFGLEHPVELLIYPLLGVVAGGVAVGFKRLMIAAPDLRKRARVPLWAAGGVAGLGVGLIAAGGFPQVMGNGYAYMEALLRGEGGGVGFIAALLVAKFAATAFTQAGNGGLGVFAPSLFVGALTGSIFGRGAHALWPEHTGAAGAYGVVGMGAVVAAIAHAPITMTLMLFEMTRNYEVILPMILTLSLAGLVAARLDPESLYVAKLTHSGIKVERGREGLVMQDLSVREVMRHSEWTSAAADASVREVVAVFAKEGARHVYLLNDEGRFAGAVSLPTIQRHLHHPPQGLPALTLAKQGMRPLRADTPLADTLSEFVRLDLDELPVVDEREHLIAVLHERDIVHAFYAEVLRKDALMAHVEHGAAGDRHHDVVDLPEGFAVDTVAVTGQLVGRTLRELRLPSRYHVNVVALRVLNPLTGDHARLPVQIDRPLGEGDLIVVTGPAERVAALQEAESDRELTESVPMPTATGRTKKL